jgi:hypothetical protein
MRLPDWMNMARHPYILPAGVTHLWRSYELSWMLTQRVYFMRDVHGDTPLHIAVSNPATSFEVVRTLVEACPEALGIANREGLMPLHATCRYSPMNDETISLLVETFAPAATVRIRVSVDG